MLFLLFLVGYIRVSVLRDFFSRIIGSDHHDNIPQPISPEQGASGPNRSAPTTNDRTVNGNCDSLPRAASTENVQVPKKECEVALSETTQQKRSQLPIASAPKRRRSTKITETRKIPVVTRRRNKEGNYLELFLLRI